MQNFKYKLGFLLDAIVLFLYIYNMAFVFLPLGTSKFVFAYCLLRSNIVVVLSRYLNISFGYFVLFVVLFLSLYFYAVTNFTFQNDTGLIYNFFLFLIEWVFGTFVLVHYLFERYTYKQLVLLLIFPYMMQSLFIYFSYISEPFRSFTSSIISSTSNIGLEDTMRVRGLSSDAGATLSFAHSFGVFWATLFLLTFRNTWWQKLYAVISILLIATSLIFVGRTGMVICFVYIFAAILQNAINRHSVWAFFKPFILIIGISVLLVSNYMLFFDAESAERFTQTSEHAFELWNQYQETGELTTGSTNALLEDHLFFPDSVSGWLFGEGIWKNRGLVNSDMGVIQMLFAGGLLLLLVFYSIFFRVFYLLSQTILRKKYYISVFVLLMVFILGEFKETFAVKSLTVTPYMIILFVHLLYSNKKWNAEKSNENYRYFI